MLEIDWSRIGTLVRAVARLPTVAEFAAAIAEATRIDASSGHTILVGGADFTAPAA